MSQFTDKSILKIPLPEKGRKIKTEGNGLYIIISPKGMRKWQFTYRWYGQQLWIDLGKYPAVSIKEARKRAREKQYLVDQGIDPLAEVSDMHPNLTVGQLSKEYLTKSAIPNKKTWREDERVLTVDVLPYWKKRLATDINRRDITLLLERIFDRGAPSASNHTLSLIKRIYNFGIDRSLISHSPATGFKPLSVHKSRERILDDMEIAKFWYGLDQSTIAEPIKRGLKLVLVTAQRPGEIVRMQRSEIHDGLWTLPSEKSKNGKAHRVPLSSLALELIGDASADYVIESKKKNIPVRTTSMSNALRLRGLEAIGTEEFVPHDLRRTAASGIARLGFSNEVIAKVLNHTLRGVTAVYNRYEYDQEIKDALDAWAEMLVNKILKK